MPGVECIELIDVDRRPLQVAVSPFYSLLMATRDAAGACRSETPESGCRAIRAHLTAREYELLAPLATSALDAIALMPRAPARLLRAEPSRLAPES